MERIAAGGRPFAVFERWEFPTAHTLVGLILQIRFTPCERSAPMPHLCRKRKDGPRAVMS